MRNTQKHRLTHMRAHTLFHLNILYVKLSDRMDAMVMHLLIDT